MPAELLEFEEPIGVLLKEIEALSLLPLTEARDAEIARLRRRIDSIRVEIYAHLTPWQRVLVARHPSRPGTLDYIDMLFTDFDEIHGDRRFADDHAMICGLARYHGMHVSVIGHQKGRDTKQKIYRNFGYAQPEGYRKAIRVMRIAEKFRRPVIVFVDTPAAFPGIESEERGVAEAIALQPPGDGGARRPDHRRRERRGRQRRRTRHRDRRSGDDPVEFAIYSVIPPEGCSAILWRDSGRKIEAAIALKLTAPDLLAAGIVDAIIPEPIGGAHQDPAGAARLVDAALHPALIDVMAMPSEVRLERRYGKFRSMGRLGVDFTETPDGVPPPVPAPSGNGDPR